MNFSEALNALKQGERVYRVAWKVEGKWIALEKASTKNDTMSLPYIYMQLSKKQLVPWLPDHVDLLAEDWKEMTGKPRFTMYNSRFQSFDPNTV